MAKVWHRRLALGIALSVVGGIAAAPVEAGESPQVELGRLRSADAELEDDLVELTRWLTEGEGRLIGLEQDIELADDAVELAEREVDRAQAQVDRQQAQVERRAVAAYVRPAGIADLALSGSVSMAAEQSALVSQIVAFDHELLDQKQHVEARLDADRAAADAARRDLEDARDEVTELLDEIDRQQSEAEQARMALDARIEHLQAEVDAMAESSGGLADLINGLSAEHGSTGVGRLVLPVNGTLTSRFGQRWGRLHAGIDLAASTGTPIRSAAAGRTIYSGWMSGYGNVVIVDHGGGLSTLYAHQSRRRTAVGDRLDRGDILGEVGSTGHSTGAHLHFEVRERGTPVDPIPYLTR